MNTYLRTQPSWATSNSILVRASTYKPQRRQKSKCTYQAENSDRSPTYLAPIWCKSSCGVKTTAVTFPPEEEIPYDLAKDAKNNNIHESRLYGEDNELKELIAFGYLLCGVGNVDELDELDAEDEGWKEVFAARCRKLP